MGIGSERMLSPRKIEEEYEITPKILRAALRRDELKALKRGRLVFVEQAELEKWIKGGTPAAPSRRAVRHG